MSTNEELAAALGVHVRTLERHRRAGLPLPADGEDLAVWAARARRWKASHRRRPGPRPAGDASAKDAAETRWRLARAEKAELEVQLLRRSVHSVEVCEQQSAQRLQDLTAALGQLGDVLARRLYQASSPEAIKVMVDDEVRRCLELLIREQLESETAGSAAASDEEDGE